MCPLRYILAFVSVIIVSLTALKLLDSFDHNETVHDTTKKSKVC